MALNNLNKYSPMESVDDWPSDSFDGVQSNFLENTRRPLERIKIDFFRFPCRQMQNFRMYLGKQKY